MLPADAAILSGMAVDGWRRRALVVEDHALMRSLVAEALERRGFDVTPAASSADALLLADQVDPDLLVTDIDLGERPNGLELATILRERAPYVAIVFLSNLSREAASARARETVAGASFVNKGAIADIDELVVAAEAALSERPVSREAPSGDGRAALLRLSEAQLETTRLLAAGFSNAEIARRRGVTVRAVEKSVERIFNALGVSGDDRVTPRVAAATLYTATFGDPHTGLA